MFTDNRRLRKKPEPITRVWQKWRFSAPQTHLWLIKVWFSASTFVVKIATFAKPETVSGKLMTHQIDKTYRKERLLDWELKSLTEKYDEFSFSKKSTWIILGFIIIGLSIFAIIVPFIPPRYGWSNWTPPTTTSEYQFRLTNFLIAIPVLIFAVFTYINIINKIDLQLGVKRTANFKVTEVWNLGTMKILILNGWRPFSIRNKHRYFNSVQQEQIITIKRTGTYRLFDYYIRDLKVFNDEQKKKKASH